MDLKRNKLASIELEMQGRLGHDEKIRRPKVRSLNSKPLSMGRLCLKQTDDIWSLGFMRCAVRRYRWFISWIIILLITGATLLGASPNQAERPPQPFFQDFFSGSVLVRGETPPEGTLLVACIDVCELVFESEPYEVNQDGTFDQLEVNPNDQDLIGHPISFYLINEFGRIKAVETRAYIGVFEFYVQDLTFIAPLPLAPVATPTPPPMPTLQPTPIASLPISGDPAVIKVANLFLALGVIGVVSGAAITFLANRRLG